MKSAGQRWFWYGCLIESSLIAVAAGAGWLMDQPLLADFHWSARDALLGFMAATPLLASFQFVLHSRRRRPVAIREFLERVVRPLFQTWTLWQWAAISLLAGVGEEILFRGVLQGGLARQLGPALGLGAASLLFGLAHLVNGSYALIAGVIGVYLGGLWMASGNLLTPMVTHAVYDLAALVCFLRQHFPRPGEHNPGLQTTTDRPPPRATNCESRRG